MKKITAVIVALYSCTSLFAAQKWGTPLCLKIFSEQENEIYADDISILGLDILNENSQVKPLQVVQIINFAFDQQEKSYQDALLSFDDRTLYYRTLKHLPTGERYTQIQGYRGDTEISAIFVEGETVPIAFTGDNDCYQITSDS